MFQNRNVLNGTLSSHRMKPKSDLLSHKMDSVRSLGPLRIYSMSKHESECIQYPYVFE